jgi:hypothetical protein
MLAVFVATWRKPDGHANAITTDPACSRFGRYRMQAGRPAGTAKLTRMTQSRRLTGATSGFPVNQQWAQAPSTPNQRKIVFVEAVRRRAIHVRN